MDFNFNENQFKELQEGQQQTLTAIKELQDEEKNLYTDLERASVNPSSSLSTQQGIINRINELVTLRKNLYGTIKNNYEGVQMNVAETRNSLVDEIAMTKVMENELANARKNLMVIEDQKNQKLRMAEINTYYGDKYSAQADLMKLIIYTCIPILIIGILTKKSIIPEGLGMGIVGAILVIGIVVIFYRMIDLWRRDNMNYNEYNFGTPNENQTDDTGDDGDQPKSALDMTLSCAGQACCPDGNDFGSKWDPEQKKCVSANDSDKEGFVGAKCAQYSLDGRSDSNINIFKNGGKVKGYCENSDNYAKF